MASFQSTVRQFQTDGLPGEVAREGPVRAQPWNLDSSGTAQTFGNIFTQSADGIAEVGGTGPFIGLLVRPKEHALLGDGSNALAAVNALPDNANGQLADMGIFFVNVTGTGSVGEVLNFNDTTGLLDLGAPGAGETAVPNAKLIIEDISGAGTKLAIIQLTN
jgi:hypothetical protein